MIAELKGKISSNGTNLSDRLEDKLIESIIEEKENYFISESIADIKSRYWDIKKVIYTKTDVLQIDSDNVHERVFGEFNVLKKIFKLWIKYLVK